MSESVLARSPSNIALIKYMGKKEDEVSRGLNLPENPSLSMTLSGLCTYVELRSSSSDQFVNQKPLRALGQSPVLSEAGVQKFLAHVSRFRAESAHLSQQSGVEFLDVERPVEIRTSNTFPHSAGVASSASSFSALTVALFAFFAKDRMGFNHRLLRDHELGHYKLRETMARFSRLGSGSSCRSFFGPWCAWDGEKVYPVPSALPELENLVLLISEAPKSVGSSEAHARVKNSYEWKGRYGHPTRPERAALRFHQMKRAMSEGSLVLVSTLAFDDFTDMHELFHTSHPPFTYMAEATREVLEWLQAQEIQPGVSEPQMILTMDAGPNIHVLVNKAKSDFWVKKIQTRFPNIQILKDVASLGPEIIL